MLPLFLLLAFLAKGESHLHVTPQTMDNKLTASIDEAFMMSCVSSGAEEERPKALQWLSPDSQTVPADPARRVYTQLYGDSLRLYFEQLTESDAGVYTCAGNQAGQMVTVRAELSLRKKISFTDTPREQFVKAGKDQIVICRVTASPGPEISYFRKGGDANVPLKNGAKYEMSNEGFVIKNAQPEDEGVYFCQATVAESGEMQRFGINVQVESAPRWLTEPTDTEAVLGQDSIIKCEAQAKPFPTYTWLRNGIRVAGERYLIIGGTLTIRNVAREDIGAYACIVENNSGQLQANLRLLVLVGPEMAPMESVRVIEGNKAALRCEVREAYPKASIRWKFIETNEFVPETDNVKVVADTDNANQVGELMGSWSELRFERATRLDKRNYSCVAENKASAAERQAQLLVEYAPRHAKGQDARDVYYSWLVTDVLGSSGNTGLQATRGFPVTLTCLADAEPRPVITWHFRDETIRSDNIKYRLLKDEEGFSQIEVLPRSVEDFGDYVCRATNRLGADDRFIQLRQATTPRSAPLLRLNAAKPESISFRLDASEAPQADGGLSIDAFRIQWRLTGLDWNDNLQRDIQVDPNEPVKDIENVEVDSLTPDTEYLFRAAAVNRVGVGAWSSVEQRVRTAPRRYPDSVKLQSKEDCDASNKCWLEWKVESNGGSPVRDSHLRWRRIGYKDPLNSHLNPINTEDWSTIQQVKWPITKYLINQLKPNSFYEVEIRARNDIGFSPAQSFRVRTLPALPGEYEQYLERNALRVNKGVIIAASVLGAIALFFVIDVLFLIYANCGFFAILRKLCDEEDKANSSDFKAKSPPPKIAQYQPAPNSNVQYHQIANTSTDTNNVAIPMSD